MRAESPSLVSRLMNEVGKPNFGKALHEFVCSALPFEYMVVNRFDRYFKLKESASFSRSETGVLEEIALEYGEQNLQPHDPAILAMKDAEYHDESFNPHISSITAAGNGPRKYQHTILDKFDLSERIAIGYRFRKLWISIRLFRSTRQGPLSSDEIARLEEIVPVILVAAGLHVVFDSTLISLDEGLVDSAVFEEILSARKPDLSRREIQVCARALAGQTNEEVAESLSIGTGSVRTFRSRAYQKLGVSSIQELFSICLQYKDPQ